MDDLSRRHDDDFRGLVASQSRYIDAHRQSFFDGRFWFDVGRLFLLLFVCVGAAGLNGWQ